MRKIHYTLFFYKATTSVIGTNEEIDLHRDVTSQVDYEGELLQSLVESIDILEKDALKYVYGYTIINDITARDLQNPFHAQWFRGKSLILSAP